MKKLELILIIIALSAFGIVKSQVNVVSTNTTDGANYIVKWNTLNATNAKIIKSQLYDNGTYIGLGTNNPHYTLSLGNTSIIGSERQTSSGTPGNSITIQAGAPISNYSNLNGGDLILKSGISTGTGSSNLIFFTPQKSSSSGQTDNTLIERMRIDAIGNIGIGTSSPTNGIHLYSPSYTNSKGITVEQNLSYTGSTFFTAKFTSNVIYALQNTKAFSVTNTTSNSNPFYVTGEGRLVALSVSAQKIFAEEIEVKELGWSDFVFEQNYDLLSLNDVESFIRQNKHLPGVPSAKEVQQNGINLAKMNSILLQKIEELTLYLLDLNKKIEQLESGNSNQTFEKK
jgi:hypothetical protein